MPTKEKTISDKVIEQINLLPGHEAWKRHSGGMSNNTNFPDITGTVTLRLASRTVGIRLEIEMKRPRETPRIGQYARMRKFRRAGAISFWADSVEGALSQLSYWTRVMQGKAPVDKSMADLEPKERLIIEDLAE